MLASSEPLLTELEETLRERFGITPPVAAFLAAFRTAVLLVAPAPLPTPVCRDPADDVVLATALAAGAAMVVTGDRDLLVLETWRGIAIVTPRTLLEALDRA